MSEAKMTWVTVKKQYCPIFEGEAELKEQRVYPAGTIPDTENYRVTGHKCSAAVACNLKGCQCKWSYTNPTMDRFYLD